MVTNPLDRRKACNVCTLLCLRCIHNMVKFARGRNQFAKTAESGSGSENSEGSTKIVEKGRGGRAHHASGGGGGRNQHAIALPPIPQPRRHSTRPAGAYPSGDCCRDRCRYFGRTCLRAISGLRAAASS